MFSLFSCYRLLSRQPNLSASKRRRTVHGVRSGMASIRLQPPEPFDFKQPDEWTCWKRRFEQYRVASGLAEEGEARQVCTLLTAWERRRETC